MLAVISTPEARASSRIRISSSAFPRSLRSASLMWEIWTGSWASLPMAMISSIASQNQRSSLRMWLM
jgi:hypothetical protein